MEANALLHIAEAAVRGLEMRISLQRVSKYKLENNFQVCADDRIAEYTKKGNALSTSVFTVIS